MNEVGPTTSFPTPGRPFGRYFVEAAVARGGMGAVFRVDDPTLRRRVAIKVLRNDVPADTDDLPRFVREARIAAQLTHPNIVVIYEVGDVLGVPFIAMEWIEGKSFSLCLRQGMPFDERVRILGEVATALAFAHDRGVVHRDVKPSNILVDGRGRSKLVDFGIARLSAIGSENTTQFTTREGLILGTPSYMAPEQMATSRVTSAADQFAWGVVAYEALAGEHPRHRAGPSFPFQGTADQMWNLQVPPALVEVVRRAMALDPASRFPTTRALAEAWDRAARGAPPTSTIAERRGGRYVVTHDTNVGNATNATNATNAGLGHRAPVAPNAPATLVDPPFAHLHTSAPAFAPDTSATEREKHEKRIRAFTVSALVVVALGGIAASAALFVRLRTVQSIPTSASSTGGMTTDAPASASAAPSPPPSAASATPSASAPAAPSASARAATTPKRNNAAGAGPLGGHCLCMPVRYEPDHGGSNSFCPVPPKLGRCVNRGEAVCAPSVPPEHCSDYILMTAPLDSACSGVNVEGTPRNGFIVRNCGVEALTFAGPTGTPCTAYTDTGRLTTGIVDCNDGKR
ncbi:serine/threonine-protein kinase [Labilithrix luteola]|nr:serine/threonine-protein kinase [Labilithrix luteola]